MAPGSDHPSTGGCRKVGLDVVDRMPGTYYFRGATGSSTARGERGGAGEVRSLGTLAR